MIVLGVFGCISPALAQNQTPTVTPILSGADLPFRVSIESAAFSLPRGPRKTLEDLTFALRGQPAGQRVEIVVRDTQQHRMEAVLADRR